MQRDFVAFLFEIEDTANKITTEYNGTVKTLFDFCFKPLGDQCVIQSITGYDFSLSFKSNIHKNKNKKNNNQTSLVIGKEMSPRLKMIPIGWAIFW